MSPFKKIFTKRGKSLTISETSSTVIKISYPKATPQELISKWEEVLKTLGKSPQASDSERRAREIIKEELAKLKRNLGASNA